MSEHFSVSTFQRETETFLFEKKIYFPIVCEGERETGNNQGKEETETSISIFSIKHTGVLYINIYITQRQIRNTNKKEF